MLVKASRTSVRVCVSVVLGLLTANAAYAQSQTTPEVEYKKLIRVNEDIQPLGENPFGEQLSLYTGSFSFEQTDVSLPGNGLTIQLTRSFHIRNPTEAAEVADGAFYDWDLELPRITTLAATQQGWIVNSDTPNKRCTYFAAPPSVAPLPGTGGASWEPHSWWNGVQMIIPGLGSQDVLKRASENELAPGGNTTGYPLVTRQHWDIRCIDITDGSGSGEGFQAIAPDGTIYTFDHLVYRWAPEMHRPLGSDPATGALSPLHADPRLQVASTLDVLPQALKGLMAAMPAVAIDDLLKREQASMLVTRIQDRFGNWLKFNYSGSRLTSIIASDGRTLALSYVSGTPQVDYVSVTAGDGSSRKWNYSYGTGSGSYRPGLQAVDLPDGSSWQYDLGSFVGADLDSQGGSCERNATLATGTWAGSITHPSGLTGSFTVKAITRGRSYVPKQCFLFDGDPNASFAQYPRVYYQFALVQKSYSGAGIAPQTWHYAYSPANESWLQDCSAGCVSTVWTEVDDPAANATRYTFSNRFDETEGQLQRTDYYLGAFAGGAPKRSELESYAPSDAGPWPSTYGYNMLSRMNSDVVQQEAPKNQHQVVQDGDTYTWQAEAFNSYAQVTKTRRSNSTGQPAVEEQTDYRNDNTLWVLGLPTKVTNLTTGEVVDQNVYNPTDDTLAERWHFGQKLMSYSFNAQGQLASFTDGNANTTKLDNYKRGIPALVTYPDHTLLRLVIDDFGQIRSITDQALAETSYTYDEVGRLTRIDYPVGDERAWNAKTFAYDPITTSEYGINGLHWRRTITKGSSRQVSYFDAELRPILTHTYISNVAGSDTYTRTDFDFKGQPTFASYPVASAASLSDISAGTHNEYDVLGRLTYTRQDSEFGPKSLVTHIEYPSGAQKKITDPKNHITTTTYQAFDTPNYDAPILVQAPAGVNQRITRDFYGNPTAIRQYGTYDGLSGDITKTLVYDSHHRLCRTIEPESGSEVMDYDDANNLAWSAAGLTLPPPTTGTEADCYRGQVADAGKTKRQYDSLNRLWTLTPPTDTQSTTYHYDPVGNLDSAVSGITTWSAKHNMLGQLVSETLQLTAQEPWTIGYSHDANGSLASLTYPDGEVVGYTPDALGRPTRVGTYASSIKYLPNGEVASFAFGNGVLYNAQPNERQLLQNFSYGADGALALSEDLDYDKNGNITTVSDLSDPGDGRRSKSFGYDDLNRLTSATATNLWGTESYHYDPLNNIRERVGNSSTFTYNYDPTNKLASISGAGNSSFGYDNRGNVTSRNGNTLQFDQKNQLAQIEGLASYSYDAAGRRVMKTRAGGSPTDYFYTQAGQLLFQIQEGLSATNFIYLGHKLIASNDTSLLEPPPPPTVTAPSSSTTGNYTISWDGLPGNTFTLQEQPSGGNWVLLQTGKARSFDVSGRASGTYGYQVKVCNSIDCTWSPTATVSVLLPPKTPAAIIVPATSSGSVAVSWSASATASSYTLEHRLGAGTWDPVYTGSATSRTVAETATGSYTYRVKACNAAGCSTGYVTSSAVSVTIKPASAPSLTVPPTSSTGNYTVSWGAVSGASSYTLQELVSGVWGNAYTGSARSKTFSKGNGTFGYRVRASNAGGDGPWSGTSSIVVDHIPATPAAPNASYTGTSYKPTVTVRWLSEAYASTYELQQTDPQNGTNTVYSGTATSWTQFVIANGQVTYRVRACSNAGCSGYSNYSVGLMLSSGAGGLGEPALEAAPETPPATNEATPSGDPPSSGSLETLTDGEATNA
jgi:YD repeat-containing protein